MGMYDYLGDKQVKFFYIPYLVSERRVNVKMVNHSGGALRYYGIGDKLPLKTLYYQLPAKFMLFDFSFENEDIWIIKDSELYKQITLSELKEEDFVSPVLSRFGSLLNVNVYSDLFQLMADCKAQATALKEVEEKYYPEGSMKMIRTDIVAYTATLDKYESDVQQVSDKYMNKWFAAIDAEEEKMKEFGEFLYIYIKSEDKVEQDYCLEQIRSMIAEDVSIVPKFQQWQGFKDRVESHFVDIDYEKLCDELEGELD